jgi:hypothetical protein
MKSNTTKEYPYTGDYYGYTIITSSDGTTTSKQYVTVPTSIKMILDVNLLGDLNIESESKLQLNGYVGNILDRNGDEIYVDGLWEIFQTAPLLGPLGIKAGYKYRARIIQGNV